MANKRHKPEEIVTKLRPVELLRGQGIPMVGRQDADKAIVEDVAYGKSGSCDPGGQKAVGLLAHDGPIQIGGAKLHQFYAQASSTLSPIA